MNTAGHRQFISPEAALRTAASPAVEPLWMSFISRIRIVLAAAVLGCSTFFGVAAEGTIARFQTSVGNIDVRLYNSATPISVANFLNYVTSNRYSGTFIHRVPQRPASQGGGTSNFVVQGGGFLLNNSIFQADGIVTDPPIGNEPGITNIRGTLAFAKNSLGATSQWFFNIGDNSFLDAQDFTVFGRVVGNGMTVVDAINNLRTVNASVAQNEPGEDFDEIPVTNFDRVISQNDITNNEAVMVNSVTILNLPAGDYDFNGIVNIADYSVWRQSYDSTTSAEADGNGNGIVDLADFVVWRNSMAGSAAGAGTSPLAVPEPAAAFMAMTAAALLVLRRRRSR
jgi:peptidyl-prolyl cis-trans isomerase A (cyclophilin A)